jgi:hypothetical protein
MLAYYVCSAILCICMCVLKVLQQALSAFMYQLARSPVTLGIIGNGRQDILTMLQFIQKHPVVSWSHLSSWRRQLKEYTGITSNGSCSSLYAAATNR